MNDGSPVDRARQPAPILKVSEVPVQDHGTSQFTGSVFEKKSDVTSDLW